MYAFNKSLLVTDIKRLESLYGGIYNSRFEYSGYRDDINLVDEVHCIPNVFDLNTRYIQMKQHLKGVILLKAILFLFF